MRAKRFALVGSLGLAAALGLAGCGAAATAPESATQVVVAATGASAAPSEATVAGLFDEWNAALATGDPEKVADRYAPDAVLLPTVSNIPRTDRAGIVDYFTEFLKSKPRGKITFSRISILDDTTAVDAGTYTFTLTKDGETTEVPARYTFVYEYRDGRWLIINHHSSKMPES